MSADKASQIVAQLDDVAHRERAVLSLVGHNNPPEPTPFDMSREEIEGLYMEAKNWCDGARVETQEQADAVGKLVSDLRAAKKLADDRRAAEAKPFDEGKAEVQARYNPLIQKDRGKADLALDACKAALVPFVAKKDAELRAKAEAARVEAEKAQRAAREAMEASCGDLHAREDAEALAKSAKAAEKASVKAGKATASVGGGARAITARTRWIATLADRKEAARFVWQECPDLLDAVLLKIGQDFADAGRRTLPGYVISETTSVQ